MLCCMLTTAVSSPIRGTVSLPERVTLEQPVSIILSGDVTNIPNSDLVIDWQWRFADSNEWHTIPNEHGRTYTPASNDAGTFIRVLVKAKGYDGGLYSSEREIMKKICPKGVTVPKLEVMVDDGQIVVKNSLPTQQYLVLAEYNTQLSEDAWSSALTGNGGDLTFSGKKFAANYVYIRVKETLTTLPSTTNIMSVQLAWSGIKLTPLCPSKDSQYYYNKNGFLAIDIAPVSYTIPDYSYGGFKGVSGDQLFVNGSNSQPYARFYASTDTSSPLEAGKYYRRVYLQVTESINNVEVSVATPNGNYFLRNNFFYHVGDENNNVLLDWVNVDGEISVTEGEVCHVPFTYSPSIASTLSVTAEASGPGKAPILSFDDPSKGLIVAAWDATPGTYIFKLTQQGKVLSTTITVTVKERQQPVEKLPHEVAFSNEYPPSVTFGEPFTPPLLSNSHHLPITYTSSDPTVATVDAATGAVTILRAGATFIKAIIDGGETYQSGTALYRLEVLKRQGQLSFDSHDYNLVIGETFKSPVLNNPLQLPVTYSSDTPETATVDENGVVTIIGVGGTYIRALFAGDDTTESSEAEYYLWVQTPGKQPCDLAFSEKEVEAYFAEPFTPPTLLNPHHLPITWTTSNPNVATVDAVTGEVTFVREGGCSIYAHTIGNDAYLGGDVYYGLYIHQQDPGLSYNLEIPYVTVTLGDDYHLPVLQNRYNVPVVFSSSNPSVATVDETGNVTIVGVGEALITAQFSGNNGFSSSYAEYFIQVEQKIMLPSGLAFSKTAAEATIGKPFTPPTLQNPNNLPVTWSSSDATVATVDAVTGAVTFVKEGSVDIWVRFEGNNDYEAGEAYYRLTVSKQSPSLSYRMWTPVTVTVGGTYNLPELYNPYNLAVNYSSSNPSVATVDEAGSVTIVGEGRTTIAAKFSGNDEYRSGSASYNLVVVPKQPSELALNKTAAEATIGESFTPPTLQNPNNLPVTWSSSDATVATVDAVTGEVTIVGEGETTIMAQFAGNDEFKDSVVTYTLTVKQKVDTGIAALGLPDSSYDIYDVNGKKIKGGKLRKGIYIVRPANGKAQGTKSRKLMVK